VFQHNTARFYDAVQGCW